MNHLDVDVMKRILEAHRGNRCQNMMDEKTCRPSEQKEIDHCSCGQNS
jgi:hypothetical protein